ncbi:MAG: DUF2284 domain-containing protein [Candidatus Atribacteria bacterium]|nr:DUF2284 domain-containing protein [Candidatus Atribacteria bacterium]
MSRGKVEAVLEEFLAGKVRAYRIVDPREVVTAEWVRLKCQYGCDGYGQSLTCPPYSPTPEVTRKMLDSYSRAVLIWKPEEYHNLREICAHLERELFLAGYEKAFAMPSGPCELCGTCPLQYPCRYPESARPSMEACGIDVYTTVRKFGFPLQVVRSRSERPNYYALLLLE